MSWYMFRPYVSVAQRRANAAREVAKRQKKGTPVSPVTIEGRSIAHIFAALVTVVVALWHL